MAAGRQRAREEESAAWADVLTAPYRSSHASTPWPSGQQLTASPACNGYYKNAASLQENCAEAPCFPCSLCAYSTALEPTLRRHMAAKHKGERNHSRYVAQQPRQVGYAQLPWMPPAPWCQSDWGQAGLEPQVEITEGPNAELSAPGESFCDEWAGDFENYSDNNKNLSVPAAEPIDHRKVPVTVRSRFVERTECRIRSKNGQIGPGIRPKRNDSRRQGSKTLKFRSGRHKQPQVTLTVIKTKVILQRGKVAAPSSEDYSFKCAACPFATNQMLFLSKHIARHHKSMMS
jgi:hypothetical protein